MIVLSPRLKTASDMVRKGVVVADIGTDHAYLPSYLVLSGICPRALACDLRKGPLENAAETLEHWNIADKIKDYVDLYLRLNNIYLPLHESEIEK